MYLGSFTRGNYWVRCKICKVAQPKGKVIINLRICKECLAKIKENKTFIMKGRV